MLYILSHIYGKWCKKKMLPLVPIWLNTWKQSTVIKAVQGIYEQESLGLNVSHYPYFLVRTIIQWITSFMVGSSVDDSGEEWKEQFVEKGWLRRCRGCHGDEGDVVLFSEIAMKISDKALWLRVAVIFSKDVHEFNKWI